MGKSRTINAAKRDGQYGPDAFKSRVGYKQQGKVVYDTRRAARTEGNWLHGVLFVVIALIIVAWALGY